MVTETIYRTTILGGNADCMLLFVGFDQHIVFVLNGVKSLIHFTLEDTATRKLLFLAGGLHVVRIGRLRISFVDLSLPPNNKWKSVAALLTRSVLEDDDNWPLSIAKSEWFKTRTILEVMEHQPPSISLTEVSHNYGVWFLLYWSFRRL